jgi:hypothetical protein
MRSKDVAAELLYVVKNTYVGCIDRLYTCNLYLGILLYMLYTIYCHCSVLGATIYTPLSFATCFGCTQPSSGNDVLLDSHTVLVLLGSIKVSVF